MRSFCWENYCMSLRMLFFWVMFVAINKISMIKMNEYFIFVSPYRIYWSVIFEDWFWEWISESTTTCPANALWFRTWTASFRSTLRSTAYCLWAWLAVVKFARFYDSFSYSRTHMKMARTDTFSRLMPTIKLPLKWHQLTGLWKWCLRQFQSYPINRM